MDIPKISSYCILEKYYLDFNFFHACRASLKKDTNHLKIAWHSKREKKSIEQRESKTKNEQSQTTTNIFLPLLFNVEKFKLSKKNYLGKVSAHCYICIIVFSCGRLLEM